MLQNQTADYDHVMNSGRLEILVEPFKEGDPGPHVMAVIDLVKAHGFTVDMGPFSSIVEGDLGALTDIIGPLMRAGFDAGATNIQTRLQRL